MTIASLKARSIGEDMLAARKASVPFVALRTTDPARSLGNLIGDDRDRPTYLAVEKVNPNPPILRWNQVSGLEALNDEGTKALAAILTVLSKEKGKPDQKIPLDATAKSTPPDAGLAMTLTLLRKAPADTVTFIMNAHLMWKTASGHSNPIIVNAIGLMREIYKDGRTLVFVTPPGATLPEELATDVINLEEPMPTEDDLRAVVLQAYSNVFGMAYTPEPDIVEKSVSALKGARSVFIAEQAASMCIGGKGMDLAALWAQKVQMVNDTPGLKWVEPSTSFANLAGSEAFVEFLDLVFNGKAAPDMIVFLDEIDDQMAGVGSDSSGVSTAINGKFLVHITKSKAKGVLSNGHPGTGKTAFWEAASAQYGVPMIEMDLGNMKHSHVGQSEANAERAFSTIGAIARRVLYVGTCNSVGNLRPQVRRRLPWRFFFDLPTNVEKSKIWPIYETKPHDEADGPLTAAQVADRPDDKNWTPADIKECCENAWRFNITLKKAADYVLPIAISAPEDIDARRQEAANRYLSAAYPGFYRLKNEDAPKVKTQPDDPEYDVAVIAMPRKLSTGSTSMVNKAKKPLKDMN